MSSDLSRAGSDIKKLFITVKEIEVNRKMVKELGTLCAKEYVELNYKIEKFEGNIRDVDGNFKAKVA